MIALPAENDRHEPLPLDPIGQRLCQTFPYLWQAIVGVNEPEDPQWQTITGYPLRPRVLWKLWQDAAQLVGVRFDNQTRYALVDIDRASPYHPLQDPQALRTIQAALETIGIYRTVLIRSSWSEGLHLYIPLPEAVPTFGIATALKQCLEAQGLAIAPGQLEIFPNCKAYATPGTFIEYNAHRLPLQPVSGSWLLDADGNPISNDLGQFFQQWDIAAAGQAMEELRGAIATARANRKGRPHRQSTVIQEWVQDLRTEMEAGWTGSGQTNHLLKTIACYGVVFEGLKGDALAEYIQRTAASLPGYEQWCRHQHEIHLRATVWARAAEGYYWPLGGEPKRSGSLHNEAENNIVSLNLVRSQDAQRRIREAVSRLEAEGELPDTPTARSKAIEAQGISSKTLYRYRGLWHPRYSEPTEGSDPPEQSVLDSAPASDRCKIPSRMGITAVIEPDCNCTTESVKPRYSGEFYTLGEVMKGGTSTPDLLSLNLSFQSGASRREPLLESGTVNIGDKASQFPLIRKLETPTGTVNRFPQADRPAPDRFQLEMSCTQAIRLGDRAFALARLQALWRDGYRELVEELCRERSDWGFQVNDQGVRDEPRF